MNVVVATPHTQTSCPSWEACLDSWHYGYEFITSYGRVFSIKDVIEMSQAGVMFIEVFRKSGVKLGTIDIRDVGDIRYEKA